MLRRGQETYGAQFGTYRPLHLPQVTMQGTVVDATVIRYGTRILPGLLYIIIHIVYLPFVYAVCVSG